MKLVPTTAQLRATVRQKGFTLPELLIVIAIVAILVAIGSRFVDIGGARGTAIVSALDVTAGAVTSFKASTGCYPASPRALIDKAAANTSSCGIDVTSKWEGPYRSGTEFTSSGDLKCDNIISGCTVALANRTSGTTNYLAVTMGPIPNDDLAKAVTKCNGGTANTTTRCVGTPGTGTGTIDMFVSYL